MKVTINAELLAQNLKDTAYIVSEFKGHSALGRIHLRTTIDSMICTLVGACDKAIIRIPCSIFEQGECYIDANKFIGVIQSFEGDIDLFSTANKLYVRQKKVEISFELFENKPFDGLFIGKDFVDCGVLNGKLLEGAIAVASPWLDEKNTSPIGGIHLQVKNGTFKMMGCNQAAMGVAAYVDNNLIDCNYEATLKLKALYAASRIFANEDVNIKMSVSSVCFEGEFCTLYTGLVQGQYPPLEKLLEIESTYSAQIDIPKAALDRYFKRLSILRTISKGVKISFGEDAMIICYDNVLREEIPIKRSGDNANLTINYEYLLNVLRICSSAYLKTKISTNSKLVFEDKNYIIMIAPMSK